MLETFIPMLETLSCGQFGYKLLNTNLVTLRVIKGPIESKLRQFVDLVREHHTTWKCEGRNTSVSGPNGPVVEWNGQGPILLSQKWVWHLESAFWFHKNPFLIIQQSTFMVLKLWKFLWWKILLVKLPIRIFFRIIFFIN